MSEESDSPDVESQNKSAILDYNEKYQDMSSIVDDQSTDQFNSLTEISSLSINVSESSSTVNQPPSLPTTSKTDTMSSFSTSSPCSPSHDNISNNTGHRCSTSAYDEQLPSDMITGELSIDPANSLSYPTASVPLSSPCRSALALSSNSSSCVSNIKIDLPIMSSLQHQPRVEQPCTPVCSLPTSPSSSTSYLNMAAKTVANIKKLQESFSGVSGGSTCGAVSSSGCATTSSSVATSWQNRNSFVVSPPTAETLTPAASAGVDVGLNPASIKPTSEMDNFNVNSPLQELLDNVESGFFSSSVNSMPPSLMSPSSPPATPSKAPLTPAQTTRDPNWQSGKNSVRERNAAMFNNSLMADVTFLVGQPSSESQRRRIPAHKYILCTGSTVFYAMLYGSLAEVNDEIVVPDVDPDAFLALLNYLYTDEIHLEPDNVLATLYAAKKYIVPYLAKVCVKYLETSLSAKNACLLLSQSRLFEEPELMQRCWDVIDAQAEIALKSEGFTDIDFHTLQTILNRETLNCKEIVVFQAASNWASAEGQRRNLEVTPQLCREILGPAMYLIRFPAMNVEEFADNAAQSGMLSLQETTDIFLNFTAKQKPNLLYPVKPRIGMKPQICHRFQSSAYRSNQWRYRGRCDSIQFCVDRRIFIVGFGLYGSSSGSANYAVKIELKQGGKVMATNTQNFFSDGSSNTFHVFFDHPVQVEADKSYTASALLDGSELSYFGQEGLSEVLVSRVTFQFQCSSESTNGTGVQGGQIPEIIFYGPNEI